MTELDRMRLERGVQRLYAQGPRAVCELFAEMAECGDAVPHLLGRLDAYNTLTPAMLPGQTHEMRVLPTSRRIC